MTTPLKLLKITPILIVDAIEGCFGFWTALGFEKTVEVPEADGTKIGFAMLVKDGMEIMYQIRNSIRADLPALGTSTATSLIYLEVSSLGPVLSSVKPADVVVPRRTTPYGADEVFVREPGGHVIGFAVQSQ